MTSQMVVNEYSTHHNLAEFSVSRAMHRFVDFIHLKPV